VPGPCENHIGSFALVAAAGNHLGVHTADVDWVELLHKAGAEAGLRIADA
jgi:hypothetical protein